MLGNTDNLQVIGSTLIDVGRDNHIHYAESKALSILYQHVATGAFHNSSEIFNPPKCHPRTRLAILNQIQNWYRNRDPSSPRLTWLYGPAGAGKSAIAQTTAEACQELGTLAACFVFSRTAPSRDNADRLMATIAYQVALAIPTTLSHIQHVLESDPLIFSKSMDTQLRRLIIDPILAVVSNGVLDSKLIIIDGLDECNDRAVQSKIVRCFASAVMHQELSLSVLILSRPEQPIRDTFSRSDLNGKYTSIVLGEDYTADADVERYLRDSFEEIQQTHTLKSYIPKEWPSNKDIRLLVRKSSGQFIFASTVIRFVKSPRHRPMDRLRKFLEIGAQQDTSPFRELDALYTYILDSADKSQRAIMLRIFGFLLFHKDGLFSNTTSLIEPFLGLRTGDLDLALIDCHSIIQITEHWNKKSVVFFHASIPDFFTDSARSREFFLDKGRVHADLSRMCMAGLSSAGK